MTVATDTITTTATTATTTTTDHAIVTTTDGIIITINNTSIGSKIAGINGQGNESGHTIPSQVIMSIYAERKGSRQ